MNAATFLLDAVIWIGLGTVLLGMGLCLWRLVRGPELADRVLASDSLAIHVVGLVLLLCLQRRSGVLLDAALVVALIGFASTIAFGQYLAAQAARPRTEAPASAEPASSDP